MNEMKKNIRRVFWLYFALFIVVVVYLGHFILIDSAGMINSTFNPRLNINDFSIKRGYIFDADGNILARSVPAYGEFRRVFPYGNEFAHTVGFIGITKSGVEARYNFDLDNIDFEIIQRLQREFINGEPLRGDNVHLTLELDMQRLAVENLRGVRGAIVAMEPHSGRIIAMASTPDFNPNSITDIWRDLTSDTENSPLLNRATQGLYPPGSVFKLVTADAIMTHMPNYMDFYVECHGTAVFDGVSLRCFNARAHGRVNISDAMKYSCNIFFAEALIEIGYERLLESAERMAFNSAQSFDLEYVRGRYSMESGAGTGEIIQTAIGQGRTLTTPLHMALITAAVANDGLMPMPHVGERISAHTGRVKWERRRDVPIRVMSTWNAAELTDMMVRVVEGGTGTVARVPGVTVAGKTGTAEVASGEAHGWFASFAPAHEPEIVLVVITENTGGTQRALEITRNMLMVYFAR